MIFFFSAVFLKDLSALNPLLPQPSLTLWSNLRQVFRGEGSLEDIWFLHLIGK